MTYINSDKLESLALEKIKSLFGTPEGEFNSTLFISHHMEELEEADWLSLLKVKQPKPQQILKALVLVDKWDSNEDGQINTYDFSLPENITDYLISVRFSEDGKIKDASLES